MSQVVMVIGQGAREHALAAALARSPQVARVLVAPGNAGMEAAELALPKVECVTGASLDPEELLALAVQRGVHLTVVGPEGPLAAGIVDTFEAAGRRIFGPTRRAAEIETSKAFAKDLMQRHQIPTPRGQAFTSYTEARHALELVGAPIVIKASGLAAGKGVFVCDDLASAHDALWRLMEAGELGPAGREVLIEERLFGDELSVMALTDGVTLRLLPVARDHKRLKDHDRGPNTGGMGAFAPVPEVTPAFLERVEREVMAPAIRALAAEGRPFRGVLYAGLMRAPAAHGGHVHCLEFNARLGDPEAQVLLSLLDGDLFAILEACLDGRLAEVPLAVSSDAVCAVVVAAPGYPERVRPGSAIGGLEAARARAHAVYTAGVERLSHGLTAVGGRVLTVVGRGATLGAAVRQAYDAVDQITMEGAQVRRDIGASAMGFATSASAGETGAAGAYAAAGVDIEAGNAAVRGMKAAVESTFNPFVLSKLGSFGGLFDARAFAGLRHPVLVASTDGVGTKTMIAAAVGRWNTIGRDLAAHSVNDILVMGARPLFFLDYVAAAKLDPRVIAEVVTGLCEACREYGVAVLGGETAEMPGVYRAGEVDLAGTIVGVVEKDEILDGTRIAAGDVVLGLRSSGLHTNGYSLARKALEGLDLGRTLPGFGASLGEVLLAPHRPYLSEIMTLWDAGVAVNGLVHVTGGGFVDNPPRLTGPELAWELDLHAWEWPAIFRLIQARAAVPEAELARVMNLGIGMLVVVPKNAVGAARESLPELVPMGRIVARDAAAASPRVRFVRGAGEASA